MVCDTPAITPLAPNTAKHQPSPTLLYSAASASGKSCVTRDMHSIAVAMVALTCISNLYEVIRTVSRVVYSHFTDRS